MIVCKNCGHQNEDNDTFCGSCGKFLEWTGERVAVAEPEPEPAPPPPAPEPQPTHHGFIDRVKQAVGIDEAPASAPAPSPEPSAPSPAATVPSPPPTAPAATPSTPAPAWYTAPASATSPTPVGPPAAPPAAPQSSPLRPVVLSSAAPPAAAPTTGPAQLREPQPVLAGASAPVAPPPPATGPTTQEPASQKPGYVEPASQKPTYAAQPKQYRPARVQEAPTRKAGPNDVYCGQCGEVNDRSRHFCRRCGATLAEAVEVRLPWYRRLWNRLFNRTYQAGYRHGRIGPPNVLGGVFRIIRLALAAVVLLAILAFALIPSFRNGVINRVSSTITPLRVQFFPHYDAIYASSDTASSAIPGHPPKQAIDTFINTYWAAAPSDRAPYLKITFQNPVNIAEIGFDSGASGPTPADSYVNQPRPQNVHLVFSDGVTKDLALKDDNPAVTHNAQFYAVDAKNVTFVEVFIDTTYGASTLSPVSSVAISEVEFKTKD